MRLSILLLLLLPIVGFAQQIAPESVNNAGGKMTQSNGSLSFTVGELVVLSFADFDGNTLNGGFTSGATITTVNTSDVDQSLMSVRIYPNPSTELVTFEIKESHLDAFNIQIVDNAGKIISSGSHSGLASKIGINCSSWVSGTYHLIILSKDLTVIGSYKIIKQ
jgi:hypothetical protein